LLKDVTTPVGLSLYDAEEFRKKKRSMSIIIGNSLSRSPIFIKKQVLGLTQYTTTLQRLESLLEAKNYLKPIKEILKGESVDSVDKVDTKTTTISEDLHIKAEKIK